jgi:YD repeat-containing protein
MLTGESWTATTDATGAAKFNAVKTGSTYATGWGYNANSLVTSWFEKIDATVVAQMTYTVNAQGNATKATNLLTGQSTSSATYDAHGRLTREVDSLGTASRAYSVRGFVLEEEDEAATTTVTHNAIGLVTGVNSSTGYVWRWTYRPNHSIQTVTLNGNAIATYASAVPTKRPRTLIDLFVSTAYAQTGATLPSPGGGGLRGPGWWGAGAPLLWELGKRLKDSALPAEGGPDKQEDCDPCKDPSKRPKWTDYDGKHMKNRGQTWEQIRARTALPPPRGAATYHPAPVPNRAAQEAFEYDVWARGKVVVNDKSKTHKTVLFGFVVGAYNGRDTRCAIVKCSGKEIHGHPTDEADCARPEVPYP